jgi:Cu(I)/Ag(I) efflux system protein CusF
MKIFTLVSGLAISAVIGMAHAAPPALANDKAPQQEAQSVTRAQYSGHGVLRAVKPNKVQIAHEPIAELQWPAMTMWFVLQGPLPGEVKVGDNVRFVLEQTRPEEWVITRIERKH